MNRRKCFLILIVVFMGAILSFSFAADTSSVYVLGATYDVQFNDNPLCNTYCRKYQLFTFEDNGVSWYSPSTLPLSSLIAVCTKNYQIGYSYPDKRPFVDIRYNCGPNYLTTRTSLERISSVTIRLACTWSSYDEAYRVKLMTSSPDQFLPDQWTEVDVIPTMTLRNPIVGDENCSYVSPEYNESDFTEYTYHFATPFTGKLRFLFPYSPAANQSYANYLPYFIISSIFVTHNVPDPVDCTNCFPVTF